MKRQAKCDDLWLAQARLAEQRHAAERQLLAAILADPTSLLPVALDHGIQVGDFWSPDTRLIFGACVTAKDFGKETVLRLAERALRDAGMWDPSSPAWYAGELHSDATLVALADSYPRCPALVRQKAEALIALSRRQCTAQDHLREAAALLDAVSPAPPAPKPHRAPKRRRSLAILANPAWRQHE